ncbi:N-acetylmuramoyl-L-alanine amidase [Oceanobacillus alkalisoli]|uniref:N-acetylmuramoyl-L-alanine amidase n=1 Tax=Oceanobacillus alkalisoli TaxID=2925113 RepID=UPI001F11FDA0|nr:N-acetylmuramoyl-L-alanine amidase [Oceanobacillus alkalisoli]MCF3941859.1 N-acetylmuramoyl-L-alanine amidase [Oceanobacillus alkalisoli]
MSFRKIVILSLTFILLLTSTVFAKEATIDEDNLNVRSGPGTDFDPIGRVDSGDEYEILEETDEWIKIQYDDSEGWVTKEFVTINQDESNEQTIEDEEKTNESSLSTVSIQQDGTHLRKEASPQSDIVAFTEKNEEFEVVSETENWLEISNDDVTGFVLRDYVENKGKRNTSLRGKTIVIDAGHGGRDVGAIGISDSYEKDITYLTARALENELTALGAEVVMTRLEDEFVPLESRSSLANVINTDAFLSIHYNSFPEVPTVSGIETFYYHDQYEPLARYVHDEIIRETDEADRGISHQDLYVTRQTFKPGVLLELGFISNKDSDELLHSTEYQKKMVTGIINGLQRYFAEIE